MKRLACLTVLLLMLALILTGGNSAAQPPVDDPSTTDAIVTTEPSADGLTLVKDGVAHYRIVRGDVATQEVIDAALRVRKLIGGETDVTLEIATDWVKKGVERDHESPEILVGSTAYAESSEAMDGLGYGDYIIARVGNKIVINAWSEEHLSDACNAFRSLVRKHTDNGNLILPADLRVSGTGNKLINLLPLFENGTFSTVYDAGGETQLVIFEDTTPEAYAAYRQKLLASGFTLYAENDITDDSFSTYINDEYVINAGYYAYEQAVRVTIEPKTALPPRASDNVYEKKIQPSVAQLGVAYPGSSGEIVHNGQAHMFQLADGSYIIIDGGCDREIDAKQLYEYMYTHAPDPNQITIAAWIFTHAHGDHAGAYEVFTKSYASKVKLELIVGNFPSREKVGTATTRGDRIPPTTASYPGSKFIQAHVGQEYYLRDAKIEMLYTLESYAPRDLSIYNTTSLIFTVELGGQIFLMLGDATQDACMIAYQMYGDYLKSDFIQPAHHGFGNGSSVYTGVTSVYTSAAAPVVLWPCSDYGYSKMNTRAFSQHLIDLPTTKEIFVAGARVVRLMLPYTVGSSGQDSIVK